MVFAKSCAIVAAVALAMTAGRAGGEAPSKPRRIGYLGPAGSKAPALPAFRQALVDLGYVDGRDFTIEARFAEGKADRFPAIAAEIVAANVDVIALFGAITARAAMKETSTIPIVFGVVVDPVADKLVTNLERPGGNVTGVTTYDPQQPRKQLELLKAVIPDLKRVAILGDRSVSEALLDANDREARALGLEVTRLRIANPTPDIDGALEQARRDKAGALVMLEEPAVLLAPNAKRIVDLATAARLPTLIGADWAEYGALVAYGTSVVEGARRMAPYVDKILKGTKPGDLPVQASTAHKLTVSLKTARQLGITLPPELVKKADRVIE